MTQDELLHILTKHEWTDIEFKEARKAVPKNAYETVSAFANTAGGHLVFGVKKDGSKFEVVGVLEVDKVQNEFLATLREKDKISFVIDVQEQLDTVDEKDILIFYIPEVARTEKPVYLNKDIRRSFLRKGGADVHCSPEELARLMNDASAERYDEQVVDTNLDTCFDESSILWYRNIYEQKPGVRSYANKDNIDFLFEFGLVKEVMGVKKATRAAIFLFGTDGTFRGILPRPVADCQRFAIPFGEYTDARWIDRVVLDFNLIRCWQSLIEWYMKMATTPFSVDAATLQRKDMPPDYIAFRESIINVLIHQDYSDHTRKPEIRYFTDRTIFWNPGDAFASSPDIMEPGAKEVRNPSIVTAFRRIGLSEHAGWGLRDVFFSWQQLGNVPPVIENDKGEKTFQITLQKEPLLSEEQIIFQAQLGVHLDTDAAKLFAYICRKKEISVNEAKSVLLQSTGLVLKKIDYLINQALICEIEAKQRYGLAEHLIGRYSSDQAIDQVRGNLVTDTGDQAIDQVRGNLVTDVSDQALVPGKLTLSDNQRHIIRLCEVPRNMDELMKAINMKHRSFFRKTVIKPLLTGGLIQQTHPEQPTHPGQAYSLTESGLRLYEVLEKQMSGDGYGEPG